MISNIEEVFKKTKKKTNFWQKNYCKKAHETLIRIPKNYLNNLYSGPKLNRQS